MDDSPGAGHPGGELLRTLHSMAVARHERGDTALRLSPSSQAQEYNIPDDEAYSGNGLVLEPCENAKFDIRDLGPRRRDIGIGAYCDGTRSTYFLGHEGSYPLLYTENQAVVRYREMPTGYHASYLNVNPHQASLLAPFDLFTHRLQGLYRSLGLILTPYADLCWAADDGAQGLSLAERRRLNSRGWQLRGQRRARRLMERSEQKAALIAAALLRYQYPDGKRWLLKDGPLTQFDRHYLRAHRERLRQVIGCVKDHPVAFFGVKGELALASMQLGQRSVAFMPRPEKAAIAAQSDTSGSASDVSLLDHAYRPLVSWYLRVQAPSLGNPHLLSGVVRLDLPALPDWHTWVDALSWAVLDEFHALSSRPDKRYDVLAYGIHDCELYMRTQSLSSELLLAGLTL